MKYFFFFLMLIVVIPSLYAGELHDFEKDAVLKRGANDKDPDQERYRDNECGLIWILLSACGDLSNNKDSTEYLSKSDDSSSSIENSSSYFRIDAYYQNTKTDVTSINLDLEAAKDNYGFRADLTKFSEVTPSDDLSFIQLHGLFKPQKEGKFSLALGIGIGVLRGENNTTGISFYVPAQYILNRVFRLEARGSITSLNENPIIDTRVSFLSSYKRVSVMLSYLALYAPDESIHGPSLGMSIRF